MQSVKSKATSNLDKVQVMRIDLLFKFNRIAELFLRYIFIFAL